MQVLNDVEDTRVLAKRADRYAVGRVADQALDDDIGTVGFEGHAVVLVVDVAVLHGEVSAAVCVPAIEVLGEVGGGRAREDVNVADEDVGAV